MTKKGQRKGPDKSAQKGKQAAHIEKSEKYEWVDCPTCGGGTINMGKGGCPLCHGNKIIKTIP